MSEQKVKQKIKNLGYALQRLREALQISETNPLAVDGTIQRFEFVFELFWKTLRALLLTEGIETYTPKDALIKAYTANWLGNEERWLQMLKDRNETSHIYNEKKAKIIYEHIKDNFPEMEEVYQKIKGKIDISEPGPGVKDS